MSGTGDKAGGETVSHQSWGCAEHLERERKKSSPSRSIERRRSGSAAFVVKPNSRRQTGSLAGPQPAAGLSAALGVLFPMVVLRRAKISQKLYTYISFGLFQVYFPPRAALPGVCLHVYPDFRGWGLPESSRELSLGPAVGSAATSRSVCRLLPRPCWERQLPRLQTLPARLHRTVLPDNTHSETSVPEELKHFPW